jgi:hypothetical protein
MYIYLPVTAKAVVLFFPLWFPEMKCTIYEWVDQTVGHSKEENSVSQVLTKLKSAKKSKTYGSKCSIIDCRVKPLTVLWK